MDKITQADIAEVYVQGAPTKLSGTAQENKRVFDKLPLMLAEKINSIIDEFAGEGGASDISGSYRGAVLTLQAIFNELVREIDDRYTKADIDIIVAESMDIDCGDFEPDLLSHSMDVHAHSNMVVDVGGGAARSAVSDLKAHMTDEYAHGNIVIDGGDL